MLRQWQKSKRRMRGFLKVSVGFHIVGIRNIWYHFTMDRTERERRKE